MYSHHGMATPSLMSAGLPIGNKYRLFPPLLENRVHPLERRESPTLNLDSILGAEEKTNWTRLPTPTGSFNSPLNVLNSFRTSTSRTLAETGTKSPSLQSAAVGTSTQDNYLSSNSDANVGLRHRLSRWFHGKAKHGKGGRSPLDEYIEELKELAETSAVGARQEGYFGAKNTGSTNPFDDVGKPKNNKKVLSASVFLEDFNETYEDDKFSFASTPEEEAFSSEPIEDSGSDEVCKGQDENLQRGNGTIRRFIKDGMSTVTRSIRRSMGLIHIDEDSAKETHNKSSVKSETIALNSGGSSSMKHFGISLANIFPGYRLSGTGSDSFGVENTKLRNKHKRVLKMADRYLCDKGWENLEADAEKSCKEEERKQRKSEEGVIMQDVKHANGVKRFIKSLHEQLQMDQTITEKEWEAEQKDWNPYTNPAFSTLLTRREKQQERHRDLMRLFEEFAEEKVGSTKMRSSSSPYFKSLFYPVVEKDSNSTEVRATNYAGEGEKKLYEKEVQEDEEENRVKNEGFTRRNILF